MKESRCQDCQAVLAMEHHEYCEVCANARLRRSEESLKRTADRLHRLERAVDKVTDVPLFLTPLFWPLLRAWLLNARVER